LVSVPCAGIDDAQFISAEASRYDAAALRTAGSTPMWLPRPSAALRLAAPLLAVAVAVAVVVVVSTPASSAEPPTATADQGQPSTASLIAEPLAIQPGRPFTVALRLKPDDGWHTYWRNPGDSGMATAIDWQLPPGFASGPILWPQPERFSAGPITNYGYSHAVLLLTEITPPAGAIPGEPVTIGADADWLVCREICVPQHAHLAIALPVRAAAAEPDPRWAKAFGRAHMALPMPSSWPAHYRLDGEAVHLVVETGGSIKGDIGTISFYPYQGLVIAPGAAQRARLEKGRLSIDMVAADGAGADGASAPPDPLGGLVVFETPASTYSVEIMAHRQ
jgi:DsbC/DsbD-like thiol-disulfide interchange protein